MCRYGTVHGNDRYKYHYVCLSCRRSVKRYRYDFVGRKCPECGNHMIEFGQDFAAPRRESDNQWKKLKLLVEKKMLFHSCGCEGPGWRPRTYSEAKREYNRDR